jgi:bacterioferritin
MTTAVATPEPRTDNKTIIQLLETAYTAEIETAVNYLANSVNLEGVKAEEIKRALAEDVAEEFGHARQLAARIQQLHGIVPGSLSLKFTQDSMQPPAEQTDISSVIQGVIAAEKEAIGQYRQIIAECDGNDFVTQDLAIRLLADEEAHLRQFEGFAAECCL